MVGTSTWPVTGLVSHTKHLVEVTVLSLTVRVGGWKVRTWSSAVTIALLTAACTTNTTVREPATTTAETSPPAVNSPLVDVDQQADAAAVLAGIGSPDPASAVVAFRTVQDRLGHDPALPVGELFLVARGPELLQSKANLLAYRERGWTIVGKARVSDLITRPGASADELTVSACTDMSDLQVRDALGESVVGAGPRRTRADFTVVNDTGRWFVMDKVVTATC